MVSTFHIVFMFCVCAHSAWPRPVDAPGHGQYEAPHADGVSLYGQGPPAQTQQGGKPVTRISRVILVLCPSVSCLLEL